MCYFSRLIVSDTMLRRTNFGNWDFLNTDTNVIMERVAVLLRISEVSGSSLGPETGCPGVFHGFPQSFHANEN
jgi:hypothetical protein